MHNGFLVRPLSDGPLDVVGDVHGEIEPLLRLLDHLGYSENGEHPQRRRLVFLGDLADRGPDSPAVIELVQSMVENGLADCILGNHELNIMLQKRRPGNAWFYGQDEIMAPAEGAVDSRHADDDQRRRYLDFFGRLPIVLEREDLAVVHACWRDEAVDDLRRESDPLAAYHAHRSRIEDDLRRRSVEDATERSLTLQNDNPMKLLTSGPEERTKLFFANGKWRTEGRQRWWQSYDSPRFCVFGHYWRRHLSDSPFAHLFNGVEDHQALGAGRCTCIDYSVGKRWLERLQRPAGPFVSALAALRWPELQLVYDDGATCSVRS